MFELEYPQYSQSSKGPLEGSSKERGFSTAEWVLEEMQDGGRRWREGALGKEKPSVHIGHAVKPWAHSTACVLQGAHNGSGLPKALQCLHSVAVLVKNWCCGLKELISVFSQLRFALGLRWVGRIDPKQKFCPWDLYTQKMLVTEWLAWCFLSTAYAWELLWCARDPLGSWLLHLSILPSRPVCKGKTLVWLLRCLVHMMA